MLMGEVFMKYDPNRTANVHLAMAFEGSLAIVALLLAWVAERFFAVPLSERILAAGQMAPPAALRGLVATIPMFVAFAIVMGAWWPPIVKLRIRMTAAVQILLADASLFELAIVAALAGIGEELLFRGFLQPTIAHGTTPLIRLIAASLLIGLAHCLTWRYFLLATIIGLYFVWLAQEWNDLVAPIVAHAVYDFVALVVVTRIKPGKSVGARSSTAKDAEAHGDIDD